MSARAPFAISLYPPRQDHPLRSLPMRMVRLAVHTTGDDDAINARILREKADPGEFYARLYRTSEFYAGYVGGHDGRLFLVAEEDRHVPHIGCKDFQRDQYLSGRWSIAWKSYDGTTHPAKPHVNDLWRKRWPAFKSPQHLFSGPSPNDAYVGIELVPVFDGCGASPAAPGLKFTTAQHELVARLALDMARRHAWTSIQWGRGGDSDVVPWSLALSPASIVGHEDVGLMDRCDAGGGWDPGGLRDAPYFDWGLVREFIKTAAGMP